MKDLSLMTWKEVKAVDKEKSIAFIVMAPIEEHGWCLPLATDLIEGENWSRGAMAELEAKNPVECYYLPSFPVAAAKETGHQLNHNCIESICEAVINFYNRSDYKKYDNYFLYKILPLHIGFLKPFGKVRRTKAGE